MDCTHSDTSGQRDFVSAAGDEPTYCPSCTALRLRKARKIAGLTQSEVSDRTGIPRPRISDHERGAYRPSVEALCKYADALGATTDWLLGRG